MGKVIKKDEIKTLITELRQKNKKIVFTNGCFDILHLGHAKYLKNSSKFGDILIIGVNSDSSVKKLKGPTRPINPENDRAELLCELSCVDYTIIFDENSPVNLIKEIKPHVYTKGADYTISTLPEAPYVLEYGGRVEFIEFVEGKSTTNVIEKMKEN